MTASNRIGNVLRSPGQALDTATRTALEPRLARHFRRHSFRAGVDDWSAEAEAEGAARAVSGAQPNELGRGYDFSRVRVHSDHEASDSARALHASAYAVGNHIVVDPKHSSRALFAHELTHILQQSAQGHAWLQRRTSPDSDLPPPPRTNYIFIMGADQPGVSNTYYTSAIRFYRAHEPGATMVTNKRNLTDVLAYISANVAAPIGNLFIVTHANEDGTVAFGLNAEDKDKNVTVGELREALHPTDGSASKLPGVTDQIDAETRIHLKGCDFGRTQGMVELFDEAFGGLETVTADTHEQIYGNDPTLAKAEEKRVRDQSLAEYTATLAPIPEEPASLDPSLQGADRQAAMKERNNALAARDKAVRERKALIKQALPPIEVDAKQAGEVAGTFEALGGAMFQRPGTELFSEDELKPEVAKSYGQLDDTLQASLVVRLIKAEKVITVRPAFQEYVDPHTLFEANLTLRDDFRQQSFVGTKLLPSTVDGADLTILVEGIYREPGAKPRKDFFASPQGIPDEPTVLAAGKGASPNPERYAWRAEHGHNSSGKSKVTAVGERVMAYDHHGSLDPSVHEHFLRPESDPQYYATSTFAPPPPTPPQSPAGAPP
ncbi:MAG: DUF4157 domain-containing protein [Chthoniobacteraceae bacterium]